MLFNSVTFIFGFLPIVAVGYFVLGRRSHRLAASWLSLASIIFYGWWSLRAVPLLLGSIAANYFLARLLIPSAILSDRHRRIVLTFTIAGNLALLGFFKYADFAVANFNNVRSLLGEPLVPLLHVVLPIGISFFTFTQIAFVVDSWQGKATERKFLHYLLFVTFFPHLIAGPVLHHAQLMPQFAKSATYRVNTSLLFDGLTTFLLGLAKKVVIADGLADFVNPAFAFAAGRHSFTLIDGWAAAVS
jgi:alginate O-acetyltransferase complex protein AlgI